MTILYGISSCDTVKKARIWLAGHGVAYAFHDYKKAGVDVNALDRWIDVLGWEAVLNRAGTTFRNLPEAERADLDRARAVAIMLTHPSAIKRPILEREGAVTAGFKSERYAEVFGA